MNELLTVATKGLLKQIELDVPSEVIWESLRVISTIIKQQKIEEKELEIRLNELWELRN